MRLGAQHGGGIERGGITEILQVRPTKKRLQARELILHGLVNNQRTRRIEMVPDAVPDMVYVLGDCRRVATNVQSMPTPEHRTPCTTQGCVD